MLEELFSGTASSMTYRFYRDFDSVYVILAVGWAGAYPVLKINDTVATPSTQKNSTNSSSRFWQAIYHVPHVNKGDTFVSEGAYSMNIIYQE